MPQEPKFPVEIVLIILINGIFNSLLYFYLKIIMIRSSFRKCSYSYTLESNTAAIKSASDLLMTRELEEVLLFFILDTIGSFSVEECIGCDEFCS